MRLKKIRIDNIEVRPLPQDDDEKYMAEIICYYPNPYYGNEDKYIKSQIDPDFYVYPDNPHCKVHISCFKNLESCYVVAFVTNDEEPDIRTVGNRPWTLNEKDEGDFKQIIKMIYDLIYHRNNDDC